MPKLTPPPPPKKEQADLETALLLTTWWKRIVLEGQEDRTVLQQDAERVQKMPGYKQVTELRTQVDAQVMRMFQAIHAARQAQTDPAKLREIYGLKDDEADSTSQPDGEYEDWRPPKGTRQRRQQQQQEPSRTSGAGDAVVPQALRHQLGFTLRKGRSTMPTAGDGVFLDGRARIGSLVGLFPGLVYLPEHLRKPEEVAELFPDPNFFLFQRYDKVMIDGRTADTQPPNEYALAHLCNHGRPNVMALAYNFPQDPLGWGGFPEELRPYIPNSYARPRSLLGSPDQSALVQTVVLLATTDVEDGEELLLNYRLNPKHGKESLPSWYMPVDAEEDERRWA